MKTVLQTNDVVFLSFLEALLRDAGIDYVIADVHTSIVEGSLGILPRRILVGEDDERRALDLVAQAEADRAGDVVSDTDSGAKGRAR